MAICWNTLRDPRTVKAVKIGGIGQSAGKALMHSLREPSETTRHAPMMGDDIVRSAAKVAEVRGNSYPPRKRSVGSNTEVTVTGTVQIVPDRFGRSRDCHFVDPDYVDITYGQQVKQTVLATTGLSQNRLLSVEYTLSVGNEASGGILADVTA